MDIRKRRTLYITQEELDCIKTLLNMLRTDQLPAKARVTTSTDRTIDIDVRHTDLTPLVF